jgi:hypothetical protein
MTFIPCIAARCFLAIPTGTLHCVTWKAEDHVYYCVGSTGVGKRQVEDVIGTGRCGMRNNQRLRTFCAGTRQPRIADWLKTGCQRLNLVGARWLEVGASGFMWRCRCRSRAGTEVTWQVCVSGHTVSSPRYFHASQASIDYFTIFLSITF